MNQAASLNLKKVWTALVVIVAIVLAQQVAPQHVLAKPAVSRLQTVSQPDSTKFQKKQRGDEWFRWDTTAAGHPIGKDTKTGYWKYVLPPVQGVSSLSSKVVGQDAPPSRPWRPQPPVDAALGRR